MKTIGRFSETLPKVEFFENGDLRVQGQSARRLRYRIGDGLAFRAHAKNDL